METKDWEEVTGMAGLWLPTQIGAVLEGVVVEIRLGTYGLQVFIKGSDGVISTTPSHKALQSRLHGVQVGDELRIVYQGTDLPKVKGQNPTRLYNVYKKRNSVEVETV